MDDVGERDDDVRGSRSDLIHQDGEQAGRVKLWSHCMALYDNGIDNDFVIVMASDIKTTAVLVQLLVRAWGQCF